MICKAKIPPQMLKVGKPASADTNAIIASPQQQ